MAFFVARDPITHTITDPDTGETATVEIRPMNAGDTVAIQDSIRMSLGSDGVEDAELRAGTYKRMLVQRLLVGWSLPIALTQNTIDQLDPRVYAQIADLCANQPVGENPTQPQSGEAS